MSPRHRPSPAWLLSAALVACAPTPRPLNVPGPTTAHPPGYSPGPERTISPPSAPVKTLALRMPGSNVVAFRVVFQAGSADDPPGKEGLTRLTATTIAEAGTIALSYPELLQKLYPLAASIDVHVDRDETVFTAEVAVAALPAFTPLFESVLLSPRLDASGFQRVRAKTVSALTDDLRGANDEALGKEALAALIYEGHPYGHPTLGTERGLAESTLADVIAHRGKVFCRDRMLVGVAGAFPEGFDATLAKELAALAGCPDGAARAPLPAPKTWSGVHVLLVSKPSADATAVSMGHAFQLTRSSPDFPAVAFFTDYLGLHRQSAGRLYQELREKRGLNYGDYAYAEFFEQEGWGRFPLPNVARRQQLFSMWLRPVKSENALFAIHAALREYDATRTHHVPDAEVRRFRAFLTRYTALEELTPSRRLGYAEDDLAYGLTRPYLSTMQDAWNALDEASLASAVGRHLGSEGLAIAIVAKDAPALAAALVSGAAAKPPAYDAPKPKEVTDADAEIVRFAVPVAKENVRIVPVEEMFKE